jgi:hypothetical protein
VLVDRPVHIPPHTVHLDIRLVDEPPVPDRVPSRLGRIDQLRGEPLHPPEQGHVIHLDAALGEELVQVPVGKAIPQVSADRPQDHIRREPESRES